MVIFLCLLVMLMFLVCGMLIECWSYSGWMVMCGVCVWMWMLVLMGWCLSVCVDV